MATRKTNKKLELKLDDNITKNLISILLSNQVASLTIQSYLSGAGQSDKKFNLIADFKLVEADEVPVEKVEG